MVIDNKKSPVFPINQGPHMQIQITKQGGLHTLIQHMTFFYNLFLLLTV